MNYKNNKLIAKEQPPRVCVCVCVLEGFVASWNIRIGRDWRSSIAFSLSWPIGLLITSTSFANSIFIYSVTSCSLLGQILLSKYGYALYYTGIYLLVTFRTPWNKVEIPLLWGPQVLLEQLLTVPGAAASHLPLSPFQRALWWMVKEAASLNTHHLPPPWVSSDHRTLPFPSVPAKTFHLVIFFLICFLFIYIWLFDKMFATGPRRVQSFSNEITFYDSH